MRRHLSFANHPKMIADSQVRFAFIIGVPRSGTTILRVVLGNHKSIYATPETPWLMGAYGSPISLNALLKRLCYSIDGVVKNSSGVDKSDIFEAARQLVSTTYQKRTAGKKILLMKTPDDINFIDDLVEIFPNAHLIHIRRDPRDVALSSIKQNWGALNWYGENTFENAVRRWCEWEAKISEVSQKKSMIHVSYEKLMLNPDAELVRILSHLNLPYNPYIKNYKAFKFDAPTWEAGSRDVLAREGLETGRTNSFRAVIPTEEQRDVISRYQQYFEDFGYPLGWPS